MRVTWSRGLIGVVAAVLVVGALAVLFAPEPAEVDLGKVVRGPMTVNVSGEGKTRIKDVFTVSAPLSGRLLRIDLQAGDPVVAGETVVARVQPPEPNLHDVRTRAELEAKLRAAESLRELAQAEVQRSQAELEFAQADLKRNKALSEKGFTAGRSLELAQLELKTKQATVQVAKNNLAAKESDLQVVRAQMMDPPGSNGSAASEQQPNCIDVRSPVSGRVLKLLQESEHFVAAGTPLVDLGDPASLEVVIEMLSEDAVKVREGAKAVLEGWGGVELRGKVRLIEPLGYTKVSALGIEEQRVNVIIDFVDPPAAWQALAHGFRVNARIGVWEGADILKVPMGALFRLGNEWAVFATDDRGAARLKRVSVGHITNAEAEVLGGLSDGESVVLHPSEKIAEATPVRQRRTSQR